MILAVVIAAACGEDDSPATVAPIAATGTVSAPDRPIIVDPLPEGWSVESAEMRDYGTGPMQSLYLAPGSTPTRGPALVVGQYQQESGYTTCERGRPSDVVLDGPAPASTLLTRSGSLTTIQGEINTDEPGYVFGRDLTDNQVITAAHAAHFAGQIPEDPPATIGTRGLPDGFRKVATAPVVPNVTTPASGQMVRLTNADGTQDVSIVAYDGDRASDLLTQFWNATISKTPCGYRNRATALTIGDTEVLVGGHTSTETLDQIVANLTATDQSGFEAFRAKIGEVPAAALLPCLNVEPGPDVILEGTEENVRWLIGLAPVGDHGFTCTEYVVDGERWGGGGSGFGPGAMQGPGSHDIEVLAGDSQIRDGQVLTTIGGTVPLNATRVEVSTGTGPTTEAKLVTKGDPAKQYFGAFLRQSGSFPPGATIVAYDAAGEEVGRHNPVPLG